MKLFEWHSDPCTNTHNSAKQMDNKWSCDAVVLALNLKKSHNTQSFHHLCLSPGNTFVICVTCMCYCFLCMCCLYSHVFSYIAVCWPLRVIVDGQIIIVVVQRFLLSFLASYVLVTMQDHKSSQVCRELDYLNNITWGSFSLVYFSGGLTIPWGSAGMAKLIKHVGTEIFLVKKIF